MQLEETNRLNRILNAVNQGKKNLHRFATSIQTELTKVDLEICFALNIAKILNNFNITISGNSVESLGEIRDGKLSQIFNVYIRPCPI